MMRAAAVTFVSKKAIDPLYEKDSLAAQSHTHRVTDMFMSSVHAYISMGFGGGTRQLFCSASAI